MPDPNGSGDIILAKTETFKKSKKKYIVVSVVIIVVLLVVSLIVLLARNKIDIRADAEELRDLLGWVSYTRQCSRVDFEVENVSISDIEYTLLLNDCRDDAAKMRRLVDELGKYQGDNDYKNYYNMMRTQINNGVLFGEDLEKVLALYEVWHNWILKSASIGLYPSDNAIDELIKPLVESGNEELAEYGNVWREKQETLVDSRFLLDVIGDTVYLEQYDAAWADLSTYNDNFDIHSVVMFGSEGAHRDLKMAMNDFFSYIEENFK